MIYYYVKVTRIKYHSWTGWPPPRWGWHFRASCCLLSRSPAYSTHTRSTKGLVLSRQRETVALVSMKRRPWECFGIPPATLLHRNKFAYPSSITGSNRYTVGAHGHHPHRASRVTDSCPRRVAGANVAGQPEGVQGVSLLGVRSYHPPLEGAACRTRAACCG
jgi:hypothetical protein